MSDERKVEPEPEMSLEEIGAAIAGRSEAEYTKPNPEIEQMVRGMRGEPESDPKSEGKQPEKWMHEPTGKEFESELDLLRYESGWKTQQFGEKLKTLEERIQQSKEAPKPEEQKPVTREQLKEQFFPTLKGEDLQDPLVDMMTDGLLKVAEIQHNISQQREAVLMERIEKMAQKLEANDVRTETGIDPAKEEQILQEYPELADLPLRVRLSVLKRLEGERKSLAAAAPKPPRAGEYVEGSSARSEPPSDGANSLSKFLEMDEKKQLQILGHFTELEGIRNI